jgi:putative addiction module component (TIGR02574 family)
VTEAFQESPTQEVAMIASLEELKATAAGLPLSERAELAQHLLRTLEPDEEGADAEWLALAERRVADASTGRVVGIPAELVLESLRRPRT